MKWFLYVFFVIKKLSLILNIISNSVENSQLDTGPLAITDANFANIVGEHDLVFVNFHATWCPYSQQSNPIFNSAWQNIKSKYPDSKVLFGTVDCDLNQNMCAKNNVTKYPTFKVFRLGSPRNEYRGKRDSKDMVDFISQQLDYRISNITDIKEFDNIPNDKSAIYVFLPEPKPDDMLYKTLHMLGFLMKEDCNIYMAAGPAYSLSYKISRSSDVIESPKVFYKPAHINQTELYEGKITESEKLSHWMIENCTPYIREINRENAEEITEKGLPLLILFYDDTSRDSIKVFNDLVNEVIKPSEYRKKIQPVIAKADAFWHPLKHLGKGKNDIPVLAIDSFAHMFAFPEPFTAFNPEPNHQTHKLLKDFLEDFLSNKLHQEYHKKMDAQFWQQIQALQNSVVKEMFGGVGDDAAGAARPLELENGGNLKNGGQQVIQDNRIDPSKKPAAIPPHQQTIDPAVQEEIRKRMTPPPSAFQKLQPSYTRYTLLRPSSHDEL